jgi:hypothetical protein
VAKSYNCTRTLVAVIGMLGRWNANGVQLDILGYLKFCGVHS